MKNTLITLACASILALTFSFTSGCGKDKGEEASSEKSGKLAGLCTHAEGAFRKADPKDGKTFQLTMSNVIQACGGACNKGDKASCGKLDGFMKSLCKISPKICGSLCKALKSPASKDAACKYAPK